MMDKHLVVLHAETASVPKDLRTSMAQGRVCFHQTCRVLRTLLSNKGLFPREALFHNHKAPRALAHDRQGSPFGGGQLSIA